MDPLSHAIVGATASGLRAKNSQNTRLAILCGAAAGMFPDIDVLISQANNPMLSLAYHRHFTHSIFFLPLGALIVGSLLWLICARKHKFSEIYLYSIIGMATHGLLDSMTNYGTHLFWPITNARESWSIISIIDPIFTLTLLAILITAFAKRNIKLLRFSAIFALLYLSFGFYQREQATEEMFMFAKARGQQIEKYEVKPAIGNLFAWRAQYLADKKIYIDAFHISPWFGEKHYAGGVLDLFEPTKNLSALQQQDFDFFNFFSDGWIAEYPANSGYIGDVRFAILPNQLAPLWGIRFQPERPDAHVLFESKRSRKADDFEILFKMIMGQEI